jgi:hypothetical protein
MKIRRFIAVAAGVAVLSLAIAAPASAGGPASYKVAARGVSWGIETVATNCPPTVTNPVALKQIGQTGRLTGQQFAQSPCFLEVVPARAQAPQRDAIIRGKSTTKAEAAALPGQH